jgi:hypothetical protein
VPLSKEIEGSDEEGCEEGGESELEVVVDEEEEEEEEEEEAGVGEGLVKSKVQTTLFFPFFLSFFLDRCCCLLLLETRTKQIMNLYPLISAALHPGWDRRQKRSRNFER